MFRELRMGFTDLVYPACCILCKSPLTPIEKMAQLCFACQNQFEINRPPFCHNCSRPTENPLHHFCKNCQETQHAFHRAWGVFLFNDAMQHALHKFKYGQKTQLRFFFGQQMTQFINEYHLPLDTMDAIIPIPLHPTRERERGFNQSALLANGLAKTFSLPLYTDILIRIRHTPNQARLTQKERWTNIEAAFKIKSPNELRDKNILLIDDLFTTGATTSQAAKTLKAAGAKTVIVLTLAIARLEAKIPQ